MTTISEYSATVIEAFSQIPAVETVEEYQTKLGKLKTPAILLEVTESSVGVDLGMGTYPANLTMTAMVLVGREQKKCAEIARDLSIEVMKIIHQNRFWGLEGVDAPDIKGAMPDPLRSLDRDSRAQPVETWMVEWLQTVHLGEEEWTGEGVTPVDVWLGETPEIGAGNEDQYDRVSP